MDGRKSFRKEYIWPQRLQGVQSPGNYLATVCKGETMRDDSTEFPQEENTHSHNTVN